MTQSRRQLQQSVRYAWNGLVYIFDHERNFRIQVIVGTIVIGLLFFLPLSLERQIAILLLVAIVLILEIINSVLEKFVDIVKPRLTYQVQVVKDMMAAMVLLASLFAIVIGSLILLPPLFELITR